MFSSLGDWMGFFATAAIAARLGGPTGAAGAISITLAARMVPGFIFSPFAGVLIDRYDRKTIMVATDLGRAIVFCLLPFVGNLWQLFLASLILEILTLLYSPAKEASVPKLVPKSFLPTANSLSLIAAYGPAPLAPALFALLAKAPEWMGKSEYFASINVTQESFALYVDALTYVISAAVIATLAIPHTPKRAPVAEGREKWLSGWREAIEGLKYITREPKIRAVVFGLSAALIGGGMIVPMGTLYATDVLKAGNGGYGLLLTAMGGGVVVGILGVSLMQKRVNLERWFAQAVIGAAGSLVVASLMHGLAAATLCVGCLGMFAGVAYVLANSSVQANATDELRGRVFVTLYTLTRVCIVASFVLAPLLSQGLTSLVHRVLGSPPMFPGTDFQLFGVRMTFWVASVIIGASGIAAHRALRRKASTSEVTSA